MHELRNLKFNAILCGFFQIELFTHLLQLVIRTCQGGPTSHTLHTRHRVGRRYTSFIPTDYNSATSDVHLIRYSGSGIIKTFVAKPRVLMLYAHTHTHAPERINEIKMCYANLIERKDIIILQRSYLYVVYLYIIIWRVYGGHCTFTSELVCSDKAIDGVHCTVLRSVRENAVGI